MANNMHCEKSIRLANRRYFAQAHLLFNAELIYKNNKRATIFAM